MAITLGREDIEEIKERVTRDTVKQLLVELREGITGPLLTKAQAAAYLGCGEQLLVKNKVPHIAVGPYLRYSIKDLDNWIEENRVK